MQQCRARPIREMESEATIIEWQQTFLGHFIFKALYQSLRDHVRENELFKIFCLEASALNQQHRRQLVRSAMPNCQAKFARAFIFLP